MSSENKALLRRWFEEVWNKGRATAIERYPKGAFTILIWGENRPKFGEPENQFRDKHICVTGKITEYSGSPEIVAAEPRDIEVQK
jgi:hypothetical protein